MSGHGNHSCNDEHDGHGHGEHSHSHDTPMEDIPRETLWAIIDHQNVLALNVVRQNNILKPWEDRNDETVVNFLDSVQRHDRFLIVAIMNTRSTLNQTQILEQR
jgi:hypothetical protein